MSGGAAMDKQPGALLIKVTNGKPCENQKRVLQTERMVGRDNG